MSFFSERESDELREAKELVADLVGRELSLREENAKLKAEVERLRKIVSDLHEAIGEDPCSDDESLAGVISQMVKEFRERISWQERENSELQEKLDMEVVNLKWWKGNVG